MISKISKMTVASDESEEKQQLGAKRLMVTGNSMSLLQKKLKRGLGMEVSSLVDLVTTQIREYIITGEFKPGQQLKEDELCKLFAISRPPIREAFKTLEANGLVVRKPRRGVFVTEFTAKDVEEVYTIVAMLYKKATDMALGVMTDRYLDILASHVDMMAKFASADPPNLRDFQSAHRAFHETIMDLAGNERMKILEKQIRYQISIISYKSLQDPDHLSSSLDYHRRILGAIRKKNREEALALVEEHITKATNFLLRKLSDKSQDYTDMH
jgi:DNA-binding GntR family transcriptional regulator